MSKAGYAKGRDGVVKLKLILLTGGRVDLRGRGYDAERWMAHNVISLEDFVAEANRWWEAEGKGPPAIAAEDYAKRIAEALHKKWHDHFFEVEWRTG